MKVVKERMESEMDKAGMTGELLDLQLGHGFTEFALSGRSISIDDARKLAKQLSTSPKYLLGEDLRAGSAANLVDRLEISGERLRSRRESIGWSQVGLAELCGFKHQSMLSKVETGQGFTLARETVVTLAYYLKCDVQYLQAKIDDYGMPHCPMDLPEGYSEKQIVSRVQGARIGMLMKGSNLSLTKVSNSIGIPRPVLARLKAGATVAIPESSALKLAKVLDVEPASIIISTKNSKLVVDEPEVSEVPETPAPVVAEPSVEKVEKPVEAEVVEVAPVDDVKVSLSRLVQITAFAEKHPDVLSLLDQMMNLKDDQIALITNALDLMIKGVIVS